MATGSERRRLDRNGGEESEVKCAIERENHFGGEEKDGMGVTENTLGEEKGKFEGLDGNVQEAKEADKEEECNIQKGEVNIEVKDEIQYKEGIHTELQGEGDIKRERMEIAQDQSEEPKENVHDTRSHEAGEDDENNLDGIGTASDMFILEEGSAAVQIEEPGVDDDVEDVVTPALKMLIFNIFLPCIDIYFDASLVLRIYPQFWGCTLVLVSGLLLHFIFTCRAWWRLEPREQKRWSWIFLLLQIWPQMKAIQVRQCNV